MRPAIDLIEKIGLAVAVICVALIMFIVSYDAISRYALHAPLPWASELITYYLMIAATYFAIAATFQQGDHISIDLFRGMMPRRLRAQLDVVWSLLAAVIFSIITYGTWSEMLHSWQSSEFLPGYITWPAWLSYLPIVIGSLLVTLRLVAHALSLLTHGKDPYVVEHGNELEEHHE
jgi:TRAP-type C4-dicarboxylate transport system permease small subunit